MDDYEGMEDDEPSDDNPDNAPLEPMWDPADNVYRCSECAWEVAEGFCQGCHTRFQWDEVCSFYIILPNNNDGPCLVKECDNKVESSLVCIDVESRNGDRTLAPRGTTPLLDIENGTVHVPAAYRDNWGHSTGEYFDLLARGATPLMCETFHLQFTDARGIVAWADGDIYENFAGPAMQKGDYWKMYLGRRVYLDPQDYDGSLFLEAFLEEVLLFPLEGPGTDSGPYETIKESPGIWATQPRAHFVGVDENLLEWDDEAQDTGPGRRIDKEYESDDDMSDDNMSDAEMNDSDRASVESACPWPVGADDAYHFDGDVVDVESGTDSDYDSDETFSGDEAVIGTTEAIWAPINAP